MPDLIPNLILDLIPDLIPDLITDRIPGLIPNIIHDQNAWSNTLSKP